MAFAIKKKNRIGPTDKHELDSHAHSVIYAVDTRQNNLEYFLLSLCLSHRLQHRQALEKTVIT